MQAGGPRHPPAAPAHSGPARGEPLRVAGTSVGYRRVVDVLGEIDIATVGMLEEALEAAVHAAERDIWIDLTSVTVIDTTGLQALLRVRGILDRDHRRLALIVPPGGVRRALELSGFDGGFQIFADRSSAHRGS